MYILHTVPLHNVLITNADTVYHNMLKTLVYRSGCTFYSKRSAVVCVLSSTKHADSIDLELEVDPLNVDHFSCTPLVRKSDLNGSPALCK